MSRATTVIWLVCTALVCAGCSAARNGVGAGEQTASATPSPSSASSPSLSPSPTPTDGVPDLNFAVLGDFGAANDAQRSVADRMCRYRTRHPFDLVVTTGDNIYPDGDPARFQAAFFEPYECLLNAGVEFRASLGNHDIIFDDGQSELSEPAFGMPQRNYVHRRLGLRLVMVNSNALDYEWLSDATRARAGDRWTIVAFHHPVFSAGLHGSTPGFRPGLPRLFVRRGVDLVLNGHDHLYLATKKLRGIRYVVTGGGGATLYPCEPRWFVAFCIPRHHFLYVSLWADHIDVRAVPASGRPLHEFSTRGL